MLAAIENDHTMLAPVKRRLKRGLNVPSDILASTHTPVPNKASSLAQECFEVIGEAQGIWMPSSECIVRFYDWFHIHSLDSKVSLNAHVPD